VDRLSGGPQIRGRQRNLAVLDNVSNAIRQGQIPQAEAGPARRLLQAANNLMNKETMTAQEQDQLRRIIETLGQRYK
jgi:hypothetical protein